MEKKAVFGLIEDPEDPFLLTTSFFPFFDNISDEGGEDVGCRGKTKPEDSPPPLWQRDRSIVKIRLRSKMSSQQQQWQQIMLVITIHCDKIKTLEPAKTTLLETKKWQQNVSISQCSTLSFARYIRSISHRAKSLRRWQERAVWWLQKAQSNHNSSHLIRYFSTLGESWQEATTLYWVRKRERERVEEGRGERRDYCNKWEEKERAGGLLKEHIIAYTHTHTKHWSIYR